MPSDKASDAPARRGPTLLSLLTLAALLVPTAAAHQDDEHGIVTFHDTVDGDATTTLTCEFWVRGEGMSHDNGTIRAAHRLDGPSAHGHEVGTWNGTPADGGFDFLAGPLTVHESDDHTIMDAAMGPGGPDDHATGGVSIDYTSCDERGEDEPPVEDDAPSCPTITLAEGRRDGNQLHWDRVEEAERYRVYRAVGGGEMELVADTRDSPAPGYLDEDVVQGQAYRYRVTSVAGDRESTDCPVVEITAVPFFGTPVVALLAVAATAGAYVALRRRG